MSEPRSVRIQCELVERNDKQWTVHLHIDGYIPTRAHAEYVGDWLLTVIMPALEHGSVEQPGVKLQ